jgi:hypothetical protein
MSLTSKFEKDIEESPKVMFVDQLYAYSNQVPLKIALAGEYSLNNMEQTIEKVITLKYTVLGKER